MEQNRTYYALTPPTEKRDSPRATKRLRSLDASNWSLPLERRRQRRPPPRPPSHQPFAASPIAEKWYRYGKPCRFPSGPLLHTSTLPGVTSLGSSSTCFSRCSSRTAAEVSRADRSKRDTERFQYPVFSPLARREVATSSHPKRRRGHYAESGEHHPKSGRRSGG